MIEPGRQYGPHFLFGGVRDRILQERPTVRPYLALFGCSDEVTGSADMIRASIFGGYGGIFTTRVIGSQIFFQQIKVATSKGHRSNVFEVNVHIGEMEENGRKVLGRLVGRDGQQRATCGALTHVLDDFREKPSEKFSITSTEDGEQHLDFLAMLKFRLHAHRAEILASDEPILAITRMNLKVQIADLIHHLQTMIAAEPGLAPFFVYGTIAYNRTIQPDTKSLEEFYAIDSARPDGVRSLLSC